MVVTGPGGRGTRSAGGCSFATLVRSIKKRSCVLWLSKHLVNGCSYYSVDFRQFICQIIGSNNFQHFFPLLIFSIFHFEDWLHLFPFFTLFCITTLTTFSASSICWSFNSSWTGWPSIVEGEKMGVVLDLFKDQFLIRNWCLNVERFQFFFWNCGCYQSCWLLLSEFLGPACWRTLRWPGKFANIVRVWL